MIIINITGQHFNTLTKLFSTSRFEDTEIIRYALEWKPVIRDKVSSNPDRYVVNKEKLHWQLKKITPL